MHCDFPSTIGWQRKTAKSRYNTVNDYPKNFGDICVDNYPDKQDKKIEKLPFTWMNIGAAIFVYIISFLNEKRILIGSSFGINEKRLSESDF